MAEKVTNYDPAEDLTSGKAIAAFVAEGSETKDVGYIAHALGVVARAKGIAVMRALGIRLTAKVHA